MSASPCVSIGLPVYNGENYLVEAIGSVLSQTFGDFELVICDNASNDRTAEICRDFAATDSRIRYIENEQNVGGPKNYDLAWELSSGKFFKWLAHDDRLRPGYLSATVSALEHDPGLALCHSVVEYIGEHGEMLGLYRSVAKDCGADSPAHRFAAVILRIHTCVDFYGLMPRKVMENSFLHRPFRGADRAFLAQMALRGRFMQLEQPLVQMRQHPRQYSQLENVREQLKFNDPTGTQKYEISVLRLYRCYRELVERECLSDTERAACRWVLRRFWVQGWTPLRLVAELLSIPFPRAASMARNAAIKIGVRGAPKDFIK